MIHCFLNHMTSRHGHPWRLDEGYAHDNPSAIVRWFSQLLFGSANPFSLIVQIKSQLKRNDSQLQPTNYWPPNDLSGWWFGTWISFFHSVGNNHPTWLIFFRGVNRQPVIQYHKQVHFSVAHLLLHKPPFYDSSFLMETYDKPSVCIWGTQKMSFVMSCENFLVKLGLFSTWILCNWGGIQPAENVNWGAARHVMLVAHFLMISPQNGSKWWVLYWGFLLMISPQNGWFYMIINMGGFHINGGTPIAGCYPDTRWKWMI